MKTAIFGTLILLAASLSALAQPNAETWQLVVSNTSGAAIEVHIETDPPFPGVFWYSSQGEALCDTASAWLPDHGSACIYTIGCDTSIYLDKKHYTGSTSCGKRHYTRF